MQARSLQILSLCFSLVLLSRAYQAWFFDLPLRAIIWDQSLWEPLLELMRASWSDWLHIFSDARIVTFQKIMSVTWLLSALVIWLDTSTKWVKLLLISSLIFYFLLIITDVKDHFYRIGQFFEFGLQLWVVAFIALKNGYKPVFWKYSALAALVLTFAAHGFYALDWYPRPGHFVQMVVSCLGVSEAQARVFLNVAGCIDLLLLPAILIGGAWRLTALAYAGFWGFMTSIARLWAHWDLLDWTSFMHQWLPQFGFRTPHFIVPLILFYVYWRRAK